MVLLSGKAGLSENMARRVEKIFEVKAETLLRMQAAYDDWFLREVELKADLATGRLDRAIRRALDDEKNGRVTPL